MGDSVTGNGDSHEPYQERLGVLTHLLAVSGFRVLSSPARKAGQNDSLPPGFHTTPVWNTGLIGASGEGYESYSLLDYLAGNGI